MKYRKLDANGDMTFGSGSANYFANVPAAVAQAVQTRLKLFLGEWFLNTADGTPWNNDKILGKSNQKMRDMLLKARILQTPGVNALLSYNTNVDVTTRKLTVTGTLDTIYGGVALTPIGPSLLPPPVLSAVGGYGDNLMTWTTVTGAASYDLYWSLTEGAGTTGTKISGITATSYEQMGLLPETYFYVVTAVNFLGQSVTSNEASATPITPNVSTYVSHGIDNTVTQLV